jgi:hypothetical protein
MSQPANAKSNKAGRESREPPPSLFLGPPSQNASHVSLTGTLTASTNASSTLNPSRAPLIRQISQLSTRLPAHNNPTGQPENGVPAALPRPNPRQKLDSEVKKQADRTDALWAEMQSTLEEVELSAANGAHVFGPDHSKALEDLRAAQIQLAQAWARSEADDAVESADKDGRGLGSKTGGGMLEAPGTDAGKGSTVASGTGSSVLAAAERMGSKLAEETESDILLARKRREANDRYFQRVNDGVLDVVAKLEDVASAMQMVEQESRDIWGESESGSGSPTG